MCGIAGILHVSEVTAAARTVARMLEAQSHRGPDGRCVRTYPGAVLGHVRLAIIDLDARSLQPLETADGRWSIVFNGEIYNYLELRRQLDRDFDFRTTSDTEVLLAAFIRWGAACLDRLRGMFAFCVYDSKERRGFLARDRFGQKPLQYTELNGSLVFASEVKSLIAAGLQAEGNRLMWSQYLTHGLFDHDRQTFFKNVYQLLPGEYAWVRDDGGLSTHRYYDIRREIPSSIKRRNVDLDEVRSLTADVVAMHTRSDVPVGISLSGGLDSAAVLAGLEISGSLHNRTQAYSVVFPPDFSEERWMRQAADHHGLDLELLEYSPQEFRADLGAMMYHLEGPIGGLMNCGLSRVVRAARRDETIVLLGGMGLDEVLAGYRNMHEIYVRKKLVESPSVGEEVLADFARTYGLNLEAARHRLTADFDFGVSSIDGTSGLAPEALTDQTRELAGRPSAACHDVQTALKDYLQVSKIPRNMRMMDRLSMAFGIEYRSPFLDHEFVQYGLGLPVESYFEGGLTKSVMRRALSDSMYPEVAWSVKRNVQAPQTAWLTRDPMREYLAEVIASDSFRDRGYVDRDSAVHSLESFCDRPGANSLFLWQWLNLELWHRTFVDRGHNCSPRIDWSDFGDRTLP